MENETVSATQTVEELLRRFRPKTPKIKCPSGNVTTLLCLSPECQQKALRCGDKECAHCGDSKHKNCSHVSLEEITDMLWTRVKRCKGPLSILVQMEQEFVEAVQRQIGSLVEEMSWGGAVAEIRELFERNSYQALGGKEALRIFNSLKD